MMDGRAARTRERANDSLSSPPLLLFCADIALFSSARFPSFSALAEGASARQCPLPPSPRRIVFPSLASFLRPQFSRFLAPNNIWQLFDPISFPFRENLPVVKGGRYACHINNACHSRGFARLKPWHCPSKCIYIYLDRSSAPPECNLL